MVLQGKLQIWIHLSKRYKGKYRVEFYHGDNMYRVVYLTDTRLSLLQDRCILLGLFTFVSYWDNPIVIYAYMGE